jgi:hypothetical protein
LAQSTAKICICQKFAVPLQPKATKGYNIMSMKMYKKPTVETAQMQFVTNVLAGSLMEGPGIGPEDPIGDGD